MTRTGQGAGPRGGFVGGVGGGVGNKPHEAHGFKVPRNRDGKPCGNCTNKGAPCRHHGGKSTGPKTTAGKKQVRQNAQKHSAYSDPKRFRDDLPDQLARLFDDQVDEICTAEGVTKSLDRALVESFVTAVMMERQVRTYLIKNGVITAEVYKQVKSGEDFVDVEDTDDNQVQDVVIKGSLMGALGTIVRMKRELHNQLRAHTGERGDPNSPAGITLVMHPDLADAPPDS